MGKSSFLNHLDLFLRKDYQDRDKVLALSLEDQKLLISKRGSVIKHFDNPSFDLQLLAITSDPKSIQYIKYPSPEIQHQALTLERENTKEILGLIQNPDRELFLRWISSLPTFIEYVKDQTEELQIAAVTSNSTSIKYIKNPTEKVCLIAVENDYNNIKHIKNPSIEVCICVLEKELKVKEEKENSLEDFVNIMTDGKERGYYQLIKIVDNPDPKTTLDNLYKKRTILKELK